MVVVVVTEAQVVQIGSKLLVVMVVVVLIRSTKALSFCAFPKKLHIHRGMALTSHSHFSPTSCR